LSPQRCSWIFIEQLTLKTPANSGDIMSWKFTALLCSLFIFGFLEYLYPFFHFKQRFADRLQANLSLGVLNSFITSITTTLLLTWVWHQTQWQGLLHPIQPLCLTFALSVLLLDAYMYGWHWFVHSNEWGWRFHQVHHSDWAMNVSTAYRFHTIEVMMSHLPKILLIGVFGIPPGCVLIYETLYAVQLIFEHSNWELNSKVDRWLSYVIVTPNYHRLHHSKQPEYSGSNYCSFLSIWDLIFQTRSYLQAPKGIRLGLDKPTKNNVASLLLLPFENIKPEASWESQIND
jgi:sterol desaturase/sphingolipid hydroxylase (fatty acid hydroxylase superfamily)